MYKEINTLIASAMKSGERTKLEVLRLIKSEMMKAEKDGMEINDVNEAKILLKMATQHKDSISQYIACGREDLAEKEKAELAVIDEYTPKQPTDEEIAEYTRACITAYILTKEEFYTVSMRDMKPILELVKEKYPMANGAIVSKVLKSVC